MIDQQLFAVMGPGFTRLELSKNYGLTQSTGNKKEPGMAVFEFISIPFNSDR